MDKSCARVLAAVCVVSILLLGTAVGIAVADSIMVESFESYIDTDDLRLSWLVVDPPLTIDLVVAGGVPDKGPAQDGIKYMRVNYLFMPTIIYTDLGGVDWTNYEILRLWYRGIPGIANDVINLQVELTSLSGGSWFGPIEPNVSVCDAGPTFCEWQEHVVDFADWSERDEVSEIRLHVSTTGGNAEFYIDSIEVSTIPVAADQGTWGAIKALYR